MSRWALLARLGRALVGGGDYAAYAAHMARHHPDRPVMSETEFFRNRQQARYGGAGGGKCC